MNKIQNILSIDQFSKDDLFILFKQADRMKNLVKQRGGDISLRHKVLTALFYEPSSRTFGSFISAMQRLGGGIIPIHDINNSSVKKGETFEDTIRTFGSYCDVIVIRHPDEGAAIRASRASSVPIINAGDGGGEHPTQALLDLYTIYQKFNRLDNLIGVASGDPLHSRTIKSLIKGLAIFPNNTIYVLSPQQLKLVNHDLQDFIYRGITIIEIENESAIPDNAHFWYWNRIQKERFKNSKPAKSLFVITGKLLKEKGSKNLIIMDPLPRVDEIDLVIDNDPRAIYFNSQIQNGLYIRMALLKLILS